MKRFKIPHSGDFADTRVLDGFRALAISLVVLYHTWLFSWFTPELVLGPATIPIDAIVRAGYLGVDLFFALSACVLFLPWARRAVRGDFSAPQSLRAFAVRRLVKIVPSYYLALAVTLVSAASLHIDVPLAPTLATHLLFAPNALTTPLGQANSVFWSLGTEVQFYLIFPLLARAFVRRPLLVALASIAIALGFRYGVAGCCLTNEPINRQLPAYLDVFAAGMCAAYGIAVVEKRFAGRSALDVFATLATIVCFAGAVWLAIGASDVTYVAAGRERWLLLDRTFVAIAIGIALCATAFAAPIARCIVANPVALFLSKISYNLYLWHALVLIWILKSGILPAATANPYDDPRWKAAYIAVGWSVSLAIATALTYFFERPLLATIKPQTFAFPWHRVIRASAASSSETGT